MMSKLILDEETLAQSIENTKRQAASNGMDVEEVEYKNQIEQVLDRSLRKARQQIKREKNPEDRDYPNVLLVGDPGVGKTAMVNQWARKHGINIFNVQASTMDDSEVGGMNLPNATYDDVIKIATSSFNQLDLTDEDGNPNSVLFLDELNRADPSVRGTLLTLVNNHTLPDVKRKGGKRFFDNFLFTVAAINPEGDLNDADKLNQAEMSRFRKVSVYADPLSLLQHLNKKFDEYIQDAKETGDEEEAREYIGSKGIANALLSNPDFKFDSAEDLRKLRTNPNWNQLPLINRTLTRLLKECDGTKADFLDLYNDYCNSVKFKMVKDILSSYQDVDDKANAALKTRQSKFGQRQKSAYEILQGWADTLED